MRVSLGWVWVAMASAASAADPAPMPEMYAVALTAPRETKSTRDAFDAFIRRVQELGQQGRAGRLVLRFGETGNALGGVCVEFSDDPTAQETLKPLRSAAGVEIRREQCM